MKIVYLAAGAGGMYCGACLHDNTLAAALLKAGHETLLVPTYTPLRTDETNVSQRRIFFGGVNVYLQQKLAIFRRTPWFFDSLFNGRWVMNWLSRRRSAIDAKRLGALTVSMLEGAHGRQSKEIDKLLAWLQRESPIDVIHLSNTMLLGMAPELARRLETPLVCSLAGEDIFMEELAEPYYSRARELLRQRSDDCQAYVALNRYYANYMTDYMDLDPDRVHVIPHGLNLDGHATAPRVRSDGEPFTIGYFARMCHDKGFHLLVEAFERLCADGTLPPLRLRAAGYMGDGDRKYFAQQRRRLESAGLADRFEYLGEPDRAGKIAILRTFDVMSVPTVYRESKGLSVLEALANGVPVVQPEHGAFPELIEDTGAGLLFEPHSAASLAEALKRYMLDPDLLDEHGRRGQQAVHARYNAETMARQTAELYGRVCGSGKAPARVVQREWA